MTLDNILSRALPPSKLGYVFGGLESLLASIMIRTLPRIKGLINPNGVWKMCRYGQPFWSTAHRPSLDSGSLWDAGTPSPWSSRSPSLGMRKGMGLLLRGRAATIDCSSSLPTNWPPNLRSIPRFLALSRHQRWNFPARRRSTRHCCSTSTPGPRRTSTPASPIRDGGRGAATRGADQQQQQQLHTRMLIGG